MRSVTAEINVIDGITHVVLHGVVSANTFVEIGNDESYGQTDLVCWDLRQADLSEMNRQRFTDVAKGFKAGDDRRRTRAAVVVLKDHTDLRAFRLYTLIAEHSIGRDVPQHLTTSMDKALELLETF